MPHCAGFFLPRSASLVFSVDYHKILAVKIIRTAVTRDGVHLGSQSSPASLPLGISCITFLIMFLPWFSRQALSSTTNCASPFGMRQTRSTVFYFGTSQSSQATAFLFQDTIARHRPDGHRSLGTRSGGFSLADVFFPMPKLCNRRRGA